MKSPVRSTSQLASLLGISRWTVSRALNGHPGISPETVQRIRDAARRHGFSPSLLGRGLRSGKTNLVGICLPDLVDYFLTSKIARLQDAIESRGFHSLMQMTDGSSEKESVALERFAAMRCAGVISIASLLTAKDSGMRSLSSAKIPVVRIDPLHPAERGVVASDRAAAMREALTHLRKLGHHRVATLGISSATPYGRQRIAGLQAACRSFGWPFKNAILPLTVPESGDDFTDGGALARAYLKLSGQRPTALIAVNDRVALGAIRELQAAGLKIPCDVSVIGYDNGDFAPYASPPLTTLDPQVSDLIDRAVEMLLSRHDKQTALPTAPVLVKPKLVLRESTAAQ